MYMNSGVCFVLLFQLSKVWLGHTFQNVIKYLGRKANFIILSKFKISIQ